MPGRRRAWKGSAAPPPAPLPGQAPSCRVLAARRPPWCIGSVELPPAAAAALEAVRRTGRNLRFEVKKGCRDARYRLRLFYDVVDAATGTAEERSVGLLWHEDRAGLEELSRRLAGEPR